jgi:hypothetical protein
MQMSPHPIMQLRLSLAALTACVLLCTSAYASDIETTSQEPAASNSTNTQPPSPDDNGTAGATKENPAPQSSSPFSIDLASAKFGRLKIELDDAQFMNSAVSKVSISADKMNMEEGTLEGLSIDVSGGQFAELSIDKLSMATAGPLRFDSQALINKRSLEFDKPANAQVTAAITQASLNHFLNQPEILKRLSASAKKRLPVLSHMLGQNVEIGLKFSEARLALKPDNNVNLSFDSRLGVGKVSMSVPVSMSTKLSLEDGWIKLTDMHLLTSGQEVAPDLGEKVVNKINSLSSWVNHTGDIQFRFTDLKVVADDHFELTGTAQVNRLRFGRNQEASAAAGATTPKSKLPDKPTKKTKKHKPRWKIW